MKRSQAGKVRRLYDSSQKHLQDTVKHYGDLIRLMKKISNLQSIKILKLQAEIKHLKQRLKLYENASTSNRSNISSK